MDYGLQYTSVCKFLRGSPFVLLPLSQLEAAHFLVNTASLLSTLLPKLPHFCRVHLFDINKY
uniref:Uncharacterized protein n=1 Tax=Rhinolophus ferrumequinum TaxID=59479 RepID=A0A671FWU3_RHIFE